MVSEIHKDCPGCNEPVIGEAGGCSCGWHFDGGVPPLPELAEAPPL